MEKQYHLHFYMQERYSEPNPTARDVVIPVATNYLPSTFGMLDVSDNPLTVGPETDSKIIGKGQGMSAYTGITEQSLHMSLTFLFTYGKFKESTLTIVGRILIPSQLRELPIAGGTGVFRGARGVARCKPYWIDEKTLDNIIEYDVHIWVPECWKEIPVDSFEEDRKHDRQHDREYDHERNHHPR